MNVKLGVENRFSFSKMGIEDDFKAASEYVRSAPKDGPFKPSNDDKLKSEFLFSCVTAVSVCVSVCVVLYRIFVGF